MYLWDSNILRHYWEGHPMLRQYFPRIPWSEIALPSVGIAEVLQGRADFALKATPAQAPLAHQQLMETWRLLQAFNVIIFDTADAATLMRLQKQIRTRKRYTDVMIAARALAGPTYSGNAQSKSFR